MKHKLWPSVCQKGRCGWEQQTGLWAGLSHRLDPTWCHFPRVLEFGECSVIPVPPPLLFSFLRQHLPVCKIIMLCLFVAWFHTVKLRLCAGRTFFVFFIALPTARTQLIVNKYLRMDRRMNGIQEQRNTSINELEKLIYSKLVKCFFILNDSLKKTCKSLMFN